MLKDYKSLSILLFDTRVLTFKKLPNCSQYLWLINFIHFFFLCMHVLQNMWDLTPETDLLAELPAQYTFEASLADLIVSYLDGSF